jgi:hypothetical protein
VPVPEEPLDWLRMHLETARNQQQWAQRPLLRDWLRQSRLEAYTSLFEEAGRRGDASWHALQARLSAARSPGLRRMAELLRAVEPGVGQDSAGMAGCAPSAPPRSGRPAVGALEPQVA